MMKNNSTIYKNPQEQHLFDLSKLGTLIYAGGLIEIAQPNHFFQIGDVLYYNVQTKMFAKAVAINTIESEVCGVVSSVPDKDNFVLVTEGKVETDKYTFDVDSPLYLSDAHPGKLVSIPPADVIKQIAIQTTNGIIVDIQRGYRTINSTPVDDMEPYTKEELDEIIKNIW